MSRRTLIAGNWKLNLTVADGVSLVRGLAERFPKPAVEILVCPTALGVHAAAQAAAGSAIQVGAQHAAFEACGAFTGEVNPTLIKAAGATHVLLGHSERRQYYGETDASVNKRLLAVLDAGLIPVLCIGETLAERDGGQLEIVLDRQIRGALAGISAERLGSLVLAYEPVWAIGTGRVASTAQAQEAHAFVRGVLRDVVGGLAESLRLLYGGSVKPDNAAELMGQADVDGALVGGASLKLDSFAAIIAAAG